MKSKQTQPTFEQYIIKQGHTTRTVSTYSYQVNLFVQRHPDCDNYKYKDIVDYFGLLTEMHKNIGYRARILAAIKRYYDYLIDIGKRNDHPCRRFFLKGANRRLQAMHNDFFSSAELERLMEREERYSDLKLKNQVIISLLIYQALTPAEIVELKVSNIDLDKGTVYLKGSRTISRRHLELHPKQYRILDKYITEGRPKLLRKEKPTDVLVLGKLGLPMLVDSLHYLIETCKPFFPDRNITSIGIRQSVIANWLNEKRLPLEQVQLLAGHKWISSTAAYRQTSNDEQRELINRFHPLG